MAKLLPKKVLDEEVLEELIKYYKIKPTNKEDFIEWECFSHPSLELHECNIRTMLPGGNKCTSCNHVVGHPCSISCDIQNFCLAVFAWRMGIGGENFNEALTRNLYELTPKELYDEVIKKFSLEEDVVDASEEAENDSEQVLEALDTEEAENLFKESVDASELPEQSEDDLLTIKEAALVYGCTYANIYNYIHKGRLPAVKKGKRNFIRRGDLIDFKKKPRGSKS